MGGLGFDVFIIPPVSYLLLLQFVR